VANKKIKIFLHNSKKSSTFVANSARDHKKYNNNMNTLLKNLGAILVLLGVVCLAVYYFGVQVNALLVASMVLEVGGLFAHILINKRIQ
jgi:hypothetical protein